VEPKRVSLELANQQLAAAEERLRAVQNKIAALEEALVKLKAEYTRATDAKLRCQVNSDDGTTPFDLKIIFIEKATVYTTFG